MVRWYSQRFAAKLSDSHGVCDTLESESRKDDKNVHEMS